MTDDLARLAEWQALVERRHQPYPSPVLFAVVECRRCHDEWPCDAMRGVEFIKALTAELSAIHATTEWQRWAQAVTERDAARERIAEAMQFVHETLADPIQTEFERGAHAALTVVRAALAGPGATT